MRGLFKVNSNNSDLITSLSPIEAPRLPFSYTFTDANFKEAKQTPTRPPRPSPNLVIRTNRRISSSKLIQSPTSSKAPFPNTANRKSVMTSPVMRPKSRLSPEMETILPGSKSRSSSSGPAYERHKSVAVGETYRNRSKSISKKMESLSFSDSRLTDSICFSNTSRRPSRALISESIESSISSCGHSSVNSSMSSNNTAITVDEGLGSEKHSYHLMPPSQIAFKKELLKQHPNFWNEKSSAKSHVFQISNLANHESPLQPRERSISPKHSLLVDTSRSLPVPEESIITPPLPEKSLKRGLTKISRKPVHHSHIVNKELPILPASIPRPEEDSSQEWANIKANLSTINNNIDSWNQVENDIQSLLSFQKSPSFDFLADTLGTNTSALATDYAYSLDDAVKPLRITSIKSHQKKYRLNFSPLSSPVKQSFATIKKKTIQSPTSPRTRIPPVRSMSTRLPNNMHSSREDYLKAVTVLSKEEQYHPRSNSVYVDAPYHNHLHTNRNYIPSSSRSVPIGRPRFMSTSAVPEDQTEDDMLNLSSAKTNKSETQEVDFSGPFVAPYASRKQSISSNSSSNGHNRVSHGTWGRKLRKNSISLLRHF